MVIVDDLTTTVVGLQLQLPNRRVGTATTICNPSRFCLLGGFAIPTVGLRLSRDPGARSRLPKLVAMVGVLVIIVETGIVIPVAFRTLAFRTLLLIL